LVLDGVYELAAAGPRFRRVSPPTAAELEALLGQIVTRIARPAVATGRLDTVRCVLRSRRPDGEEESAPASVARPRTPQFTAPALRRGRWCSISAEAVSRAWDPGAAWPPAPKAWRTARMSSSGLDFAQRNNPAVRSATATASRSLRGGRLH